MKRLLPLLALALGSAASAQTVVFSQYIETNVGSTPKGIEVWNPSTVAVDFAATPLTVFQGTNGAAPVVVSTATVSTGTLAPGAVLVIGTADIGTYVADNAPGVRFVATAFTFNGDDALQLRLGGTVVDAIGTAGVDPGTEFAGNGVSTLNQNIQLAAGITTGNPAGFTDPSTRFETVSTTPSTLPAGLAGFGVAPASAGVETASVSFSPATATADEGDAAATSVVLTITGDTGAPGLNAPVSGSVVVPAANAADVSSFTATFSFPAGTPSGASAPVAIQTADDATFEGNETVPFTFSDLVGATGSGQFALTITDNDTAPPAPAVAINEIDADTPGTDTAEFVEIIGPPNSSLAGLVLVLFNGSNNLSYLTVDLAGQSTDAAGRFVVCDQPANVAGCTLDIPGTAGSGFLQNGEDGLAIYAAAAASFPNGTSPTVTGLVDALVYSSNTVLASGLLSGLGLPATYQFRETYGGVIAANASLARLNTAGGLSDLFYVQTPTPGAANAATVTVDETDGVDDVEGWRLLGVPVVRPAAGPDPFQVADLAPINLVQGIPAGTVNPAQYPAAPGPNVLTADGAGGLAAPASTDTDLPPAAGFFWYFYDQDIPVANIPPVFGPGTSESFELTNPAFALSLTGVGVDDRLAGGPYGATVPVNGEQTYLLANPFAYPALLSGIEASSGMISTSFSVYDPVDGYVLLTSADTVSPWQGVAVDVTNVATPALTLSASSDTVVPTSNAELVGRPATAEARLGLRLDGVLATGETVTDRALAVRVLDDATAGWDRHDGSKMVSPQAQQASAAFVGTRDGAERLQSALSLPADLDAPATLPLAFRATGAGTFSFSWDASALPAEWQASLRDLATGETVDLRTAEAYAFTAEATARADRFALVVGRGAVAGEAAPETALVGLPYPNPATSRAALTVRVDRAQRVTAVVVDALGRTVATLLDGDVAAGQTQTLDVATGRLAPGLYVVRVQGETFAESRRLVVAR